MIYLDNAATTLHKPPAVGQHMLAALKTCAGYARSGHAPALLAGETAYRCRELAAALFDLPDPSRVIFTQNATHALNLAIQAFCPEGTVTAVSGYEHNSVMRPLIARGRTVIILRSRLFDQADFLTQAESAIAQGAQLFIINHVSNVFGAIAPVEALDRLLTAHGIPLILDASQSAGVIPLSVRSLPSLAAVCMPGHKGLLGPQGTGLLLFCADSAAQTLIQGGTGSLSANLTQPELLPDRHESGTPNLPGIAGLSAGLAFLQRTGVAAIGAREAALGHALALGLGEIPNLTVFHASTPTAQTGVLSVCSAQIDAETLAARLDEAGICVRAGLHCAPTAHETAGTIPDGTVRLSPGWFNTSDEIQQTVCAFQKIMSKL